jgi:hypothetical protein
MSVDLEVGELPKTPMNNVVRAPPDVNPGARAEDKRGKLAWAGLWVPARGGKLLDSPSASCHAVFA